MYKYEMIIDGTEYKAIFENHFEAGDFLDDNKADGSEVILVKYEKINAFEILNDRDFEWAYRIEMASIVLIPNHREFKKWYHLEDELKRLGYL